MLHLSRPLVAVGAAAALATITARTSFWQYDAYNTLSSRIVASRQAPSEFQESETCRKLVNPRGHAVFDSHTIRLTPAEAGNLSDERILTAFTRGFFGGWVFIPERIVFAIARALHIRVFTTSFAATHGSNATSRSDKSLAFKELPRPDDSLFGGYFIVLDRMIAADQDDSKAVNASHIDIGYGDSESSFAGFHRFEVSRQDDIPDAAIIVTFSSMTCNPLGGRLSFPEWAIPLHLLYARCLFQDGIRAVLDESAQAAGGVSDDTIDNAQG